jgi:hypothetical protein
VLTLAALWPDAVLEREKFENPLRREVEVL